MYKGFDIKPEERVMRYGTRVKGYTIYQNGERLLMADTRELAKRVIDTRLESGLWSCNKDSEV